MRTAKRLLPLLEREGSRDGRLDTRCLADVFLPDVSSLGMPRKAGWAHAMTQSRSLSQPLEYLDHSVDFRPGVVERKRRPHRRFEAIATQRWLCAVMPRPDRDSLAVEHPANLNGVMAVDHERQHAYLLPSRANEPQASDRRQSTGRIMEQVMLVGGDALAPERGHVVEGRAESNGVGDVRCARLELCRRIGISSTDGTSRP